MWRVSSSPLSKHFSITAGCLVRSTIPSCHVTVLERVVPTVLNQDTQLGDKLIESFVRLLPTIPRSNSRGTDTLCIIECSDPRQRNLFSVDFNTLGLVQNFEMHLEYHTHVLHQAFSLGQQVLIPVRSSPMRARYPIKHAAVFILTGNRKVFVTSDGTK